LQALAAEVGDALSKRGLVLATAESCTGGRIAGALTAVAGSSAWFEGGFVPYSNEAKREMLGVNEHTLAVHGAVSEACVREMAEGALSRSRATLSVAVSGIAGPGGGSAQKPVGTVWVAWSARGARTTAQRVSLCGEREQIRCQAVAVALRGILKNVPGLFSAQFETKPR